MTKKTSVPNSAFVKYSKRPYSDMEKEVLEYWRTNKIFSKSVEQRPADDAYVFYDGPPFITGLPHHGTLLPSIAKDVVPRFWTMQGKRVERRWGWDCHGLPAENYVEKKLGIKDKLGVYEIGLEKYITTCRDSMVQVGSEWEDIIERIGRWVEFKDAYKTMDKEFMESVWWAFKQLHEAGKIYEGEKVLMYCTRCATPISKAEVNMDNSYQDLTDPSVYVKFELTNYPYQESKEPVYMLAWTTTPWTLHANTGLAINPKLVYAEVLLESEQLRLILAKDLLNKALTDEKHNVVNYTIVREFTGEKLLTDAGKELNYKPLFEHRGQNAHQVLQANYVEATEGSGVVHLAPAYGEDDYELAQLNDLPLLVDIDENGAFKSGPWQGAYVWDSNKSIAKELKDQGVVWKIDYIRHQYPHCHRCHTKLMYRAHPSWFMDINGQRKQMIDNNEDINWFPEHIKSGRFKNTVKSAPDWNLSRDRFWATPMPVWRATDNNGTVHTKIIGSYAELKDLTGQELEDYHRPWVDDLTFEIDGLEYTRIDKVMDCWFESGSMPFAQFHYPFENKAKFEANFPGDFIVEYVGQVRAWFYYLHAVSTGLFGKNAFKNVIVTGTLAGNDGRKMSKSLGNYTDPSVLVDTYGADAYRLTLMNSPLVSGEDYILQDKAVGDMSRKLATLRSTLDFFLLYAEADKLDFKPALFGPRPKVSNVLDEWALSRLDQTVLAMEESLKGYDISSSVEHATKFIDDLSNWYVRRNRSRFWKSESDVDKTTAYQVLYFLLLSLAKAIAPLAPFIAEDIYRELKGPLESVHLELWPQALEPNQELIEAMANTRRYITDGLAKRAQSQLKVRQPLSELVIKDVNDIDATFKSIIAEEVNVKLVKFEKSKTYEIVLDTHISDELKSEGFMREVIRQLQTIRKTSDFEVSDHISVDMTSEDDWAIESVVQHQSVIAAEVLADRFVITKSAKPQEGADKFKIDGYEVGIKIKRLV